MIKLPDLCSRVVNRGSFPFPISQSARQLRSECHGTILWCLSYHFRCTTKLCLNHHKSFLVFTESFGPSHGPSLIVALVRQTWKLPCVSWFQSTLDVRIMWHIRKTTTQKEEEKKAPIRRKWKPFSYTHAYYLLSARYSTKIHNIGNKVFFLLASFY